MSWAPETCPYFNVKNQKRAGFRVHDIQVLQKVQELPELDDSDLEAICAKCNRYKRVESGDPYQCERCFKWFHAECLQPATTVAEVEAQACWTCPGCAPVTARNPVDLQLCKVLWADDWQGVHHIKSIKGGRNALEEFREKEMRQKADATRNKSMREAAPTVFGAPTESATKPKTRTGTRTNTSADTTRTRASDNASLLGASCRRIIKTTTRIKPSGKPHETDALAAGAGQDAKESRPHTSSVSQGSPCTNRSDARPPLCGDGGQFSPSPCLGKRQRCDPECSPRPPVGKRRRRKFILRSPSTSSPKTEGRCSDMEKLACPLNGCSAPAAPPNELGGRLLSDDGPDCSTSPPPPGKKLRHSCAIHSPTSPASESCWATSTDDTALPLNECSAPAAPPTDRDGANADTRYSGDPPGAKMEGSPPSLPAHPVS